METENQEVRKIVPWPSISEIRYHLEVDHERDPFFVDRLTLCKIHARMHESDDYWEHSHPLALSSTTEYWEK